MATVFSPRKSGPTLYIMPGYLNLNDLLGNLGKYKLGKSCLYLKSLESIDIDILELIIKRGISELKLSYEVKF